MPRFNFGGRPVHEKGETADVSQGLSTFFLQPRKLGTGVCAVRDRQIGKIRRGDRRFFRKARDRHGRMQGHLQNFDRKTPAMVYFSAQSRGQAVRHDPGPETLYHG